MMSSTVTARIIHIEIFGKEIFSSLSTSVDDTLRTSYEKLNVVFSWRFNTIWLILPVCDRPWAGLISKRCANKIHLVAGLGDTTHLKLIAKNGVSSYRFSIAASRSHGRQKPCLECVVVEARCWRNQQIGSNLVMFMVCTAAVS